MNRKSAGFPLVPVILGVTGAVFTIMLAVVYAVFRHRKTFNIGEMQEFPRKDSVRKLELTEFVNESSDSDLDDVEDKTVKYLGAKTINRDDPSIA